MLKYTKAVISASLAILAFSSCGPKAEPFFFVQISDPQIGFNPGNEKVTIDWFSSTVDKINELKPDFVICTGDMTHDMFNNPWHIAAYDSLAAMISVPLYYAPGNHDFRTKEWPGSREFYAGHFGDDKFCFMHKGSLFIGFDSNLAGEDLKEEEAEQFEWITAQLTKYGRKAKHIFLFHHCPVVSTSVDEEDNYSNFHEPYRSKYLNMFKEYGVEIVFSGHYHRYAEMEVDGVKLVNCGAAGIPLGAKDAMGRPNTHCLNVVTVKPKEPATWNCVPVEEAQAPVLK